MTKLWFYHSLKKKKKKKRGDLQKSEKNFGNIQIAKSIIGKQPTWWPIASWWIWLSRVVKRFRIEKRRKTKLRSKGEQAISFMILEGRGEGLVFQPRIQDSNMGIRVAERSRNATTAIRTDISGNLAPNRN